MDGLSNPIFWFGIPHSLWLVLLSIGVAICSGYVGLGLAAQATNAFGLHRRGLIAGAAWALGLGVWTMHFIGMLAAVMPEGTLYSVLLTLLSFLLCVLVVGAAAFVVSNYQSRRNAIPIAAVIMGMSIVLMHYMGMHAISGNFMMHHDLRFSALAAVIAVAASYFALRMFENEYSKRALAISAVIFGLAVSGMHYTAMIGMTLMPSAHTSIYGPAVSGEALMIVVAVLAFIVSGVFLLYLVPERNIDTEHSELPQPEAPSPAHNTERKFASTVPIESEGMTTLFPVGDVYAIQAATHYCNLFDGKREYFSPWSITEMENRLDPLVFMRIHRSHIVAVAKVRSLRKAGDSAIVELSGETSRAIPVSRTSYAELKSRLGLLTKNRLHAQTRQVS